MSTEAPSARALERMLSRAISQLLALDAGAGARLARLQGHTLALRVSGTEWEMFAEIVDGGLAVMQTLEGQADVAIRGRLADFIALARASKRGESLAAGRIEITGDLAVAQEVQALLRELDLDFEQLLSGYIGDVAAHQIGRMVGGAREATRAAAGRFERDLVEYLRHELAAIPLREDVEQQARDIFRLSDDVERAEARLRRLLARGRSR